MVAALAARAANSPWLGVYEGTTTSTAPGLTLSVGQLRVAVWADGVVVAVGSSGGVIVSVGDGRVTKKGAVSLTVTASTAGGDVTVYPVGTVRKVGTNYLINLTFKQGAYNVTATGTLKKQT